MYHTFYGLIRAPFEMTPDPAFLYLGETHREGLATLVYGVRSRKGFVMLTGEVGTGKTTLLHALLAQLDAQRNRFETHVLIVSDHGESLGEAGSLGHGFRLSDVEIHVPALLLSPRVAPGHRDDVAGSIDAGVSSLTVHSASHPADGVATCAITVTLRDVNSNPVAGSVIG